ncbi:VCBS repeat-containing protein [Chryseolinea lacunae]|uniref:VCBS repeat-containing protein n=1 Tax=Chryseolinea lacunae TaxID=2801331 RepID=A0ABS1KP71_9BACT|nr:VCBS repeat-containing protein [Chryseolinea lacunae]MBL0741249.1 VCBS repeat-containing protein [Chryseolinea lacunae]
MMRNLASVGMIVALTALVCSCMKGPETVFEKMSSGHTGIHFNNVLDEDERVNVNTYMNIYTGAGVAAGDINNDGLTDLFFSGNTVTSRLYVNRGDLTFEDITESSGVTNQRWATGAVMADVNADGWLDIYQCVSGGGDASNRGNLLFINNRDNTFTESSKAYGLNETRQSMHASFFDYDGDGDLDVFVITNPASYENKVNHIQPRKLKGDGVSTDVLYRNNGNNTFTDVSREAGILAEGYSLGLAISDINHDGWPDMYVSNDFIGNDILYINNHDGTFTDRAAEYFKHTSFAGMGNDVADINNDGLVDVVELDMRPEDNKRLKLIIPPTGYDKYQLSLRLGYAPQFTRNTLQLNQGNNTFSEISFLAGVSSTDWSWSPLLADYDNDGYKDLFVTNGFLRDLGNMDYITYQNIYNTPLGTVQAKTDKKLEAIKALKGAALKNYVFHNNGDLTFTNQSAAWGLTGEGFSHGAAYADLDNDGDLDLVVNTMNEEARIYKNNSNTKFRRNYLRIKFNGPAQNKQGIGAKVVARYGGHEQYQENFLNRGYESTVDGVMHIGLDTIAVIDSLEVTWPDGKYELLKAVQANQTLILNHASAVVQENNKVPIEKAKLFQDVSAQQGINFTHRENDFVDFKVQPLLPHMHSRSGPGIAVADVNGDGLEDFFVGGAASHEGGMFVQLKAGSFKKEATTTLDSLSEDEGVLFFDADGDGDDDLYIATGGSEQHKNSALYRDQLYLNDGKGKFTPALDALPELLQASSSVIAGDYDRDGDLDLFIGGRLVPGEYPMPADSYILRNDSKPNACRFTDVTRDVAPGLLKAGLVTSALWTDVDNDGWVDLLLVGEFMPITCYRNNNGKSFARWGTESFAHSSGWWNSLTAGDFDHDGDTDYVAGNLGLNTRYKGTTPEPLCIYANDYDKNGSIDPVMTYYLQGKKYTVHARDELISQITAMRHRFRKYEEYSEATFEDSFLKSELETAYVVCGEWFQTSYIENLGQGKFAVKALALEAQFAPAQGMVAEDFDGDGKLDVLMTGNLYATEVSTGRYDASVGLLLQGDGHGNFSPVKASQSGFYADGDARGVARLVQPSGQALLLLANNGAPLKTFRTHYDQAFHPNPADAYAIITRKDGTRSKHEFYYGSTYLSQSSRVLTYAGEITALEVTTFRGEKRRVK